MNWNHCEDFGEEKFLYKEKQTVAEMYTLANPEYKILHNNVYVTTRELYNMSVESKSEELLDMIVSSHTGKQESNVSK